MDAIAPTWLWVFFGISILAALFVDFVVLKKQGAHSVSIKEALNWSIIWVLLSLGFNSLFWWAVHHDHGSAVANEKSMEFHQEDKDVVHCQGLLDQVAGEGAFLLLTGIKMW